MTISFLLWMLMATVPTWGQASEDEVYRLVKEGVQRVEDRQFNEAIRRFNAALVMDKNSLLARYELAYAYHKMNRHGIALRHLRVAKRRSKPSDMVFQLMGNIHHKLDRPKRAARAYRNGLDQFPASGALHSEMGVLESREGNVSAALYWWEEGIRLDPQYSSNYLWASREMARRQEWLWAVLYGETFCNLEGHTPRLEPMGAFLMSTWARLIRFEKGPAGVVQPLIMVRSGHAQQASMQVQGTSDTTLEEALEVILEVAATLLLEEQTNWSERESTLQDHYRLRAHLASLWQRRPGKYPNSNPLLERWGMFHEKGLLEAYTYWVLGNARPAESREWALDNAGAVTHLYAVLKRHPLLVKPTHQHSTPSKEE